VRLHRLLAEDELRGDLGVGHAAREQAQDLQLARRERRDRLRRPVLSGGGGHARELLDEAAGDRRLQQRVAGRRDADRVEQPRGGRVLEQEAARPEAQGVVDVLAGVERRQHEHRGLQARVAEDRLRRAQAVEIGHADVHEHDVGP
jgi:hypothetical protein